MDAERAAAGAPRRRRRLASALLVVASLAVAARIALGYFAADLLVAAVHRAAASSGIDIAFEGRPAVTSGGFEANGLVLRDASGNRLLTATGVSGDASIVLHPPWLALSLGLRGAKAAWAAGTGGSFALPLLPASIVSLRLDDARIDLGQGASIALDARASASGPRGLRLDVSRLEYAEPSGTRAAEKLAGQVQWGPVSPAEGSATVPATQVRLRIGGGAALLGPVLLDFTANPLEAEASLSPGSTGETLLSGVRASLGSLLAASGNLVLGGDGSLRRAEVQLRCDDLSPAFATLVRDPFSGVLPALADVSLEGRAALLAGFDTRSRHRLVANLHAELARLRTRAVEADGLVLDLPWIGAGASKDAVAAVGIPRAGRLRATRLAVLGVPWAGVDLALDASPGRVRGVAAQRSTSLGGSLEVSDLSFEDDGKDGPRLAMRLRLDDLDLADLARAAGWGALAGRVGGDLGGIRIDADSVRAEGSLEAKAFGGSAVFSSLRVEQPFGRVPAFGLDAKLQEIDLEGLSGALGLGRIRGVLEGYVRDLVVADGQPQSFEADLHTVERRGVPQDVDVRAIVQLGVLGGGDSGSVTGSLLKVIDRYRYSAMGIRARLANDEFELHGVESKGGRDYIVKGSLLPPSVSVVSHSQVVSFSEMLRRIRTIAGDADARPQGGTPDGPAR